MDKKKLIMVSVKFLEENYFPSEKYALKDSEIKGQIIWLSDFEELDGRY